MKYQNSKKILQIIIQIQLNRMNNKKLQKKNKQILIIKIKFKKNSINLIMMKQLNKVKIKTKKK